MVTPSAGSNPISVLSNELVNKSSSQVNIIRTLSPSPPFVLGGFGGSAIASGAVIVSDGFVIS